MVGTLHLLYCLSYRNHVELGSLSGSGRICEIVHKLETARGSLFCSSRLIPMLLECSLNFGQFKMIFGFITKFISD